MSDPNIAEKYYGKLKAQGEETIADFVWQQAETIKQLKQRELELMAQVERLKNGLCDLTAESISHEAMGICRELINCTPEQSLAEHDADVLQGFIGFMDSEGPWTHREEAVEYANQLRQQLGG